MSANSPFIFQLNKDDFGAIFIDLLKLEWNSACPFAEALKTYQAGTGNINDDLKEIAENETCKTSLSILANPSLRTVFNTGGGVIGISFLYLYSNPSIDGKGFVSITPSFEDAVLIQYYESAEGFAQWLADAVSITDSEPISSIIPSKLSLESLLFVLHAIDSFKRTAFKSMLEYKPMDEAFISSKEFAETLSTSIASKDARWLLPSFAVLTPNLEKFRIDINVESMKLLTDNNFLIPVKSKENNQEFFKFSDDARKLGAEFFSSWMMGIGFESARILNDNETFLGSGFIAPTAGANHLFIISKDSNDKGIAEHKSLAYSGLISEMEKCISYK